MKSLRFIVAAIVISLATAAFAQPDAHKSEAQKPEAPKSAAQKSFDQLKTLHGSWEGSVTTTPPQPDMSNLLQVSMRVTSMGNAILHNMKMPGRPDDPITMLYLDQDRLLLTHYCDAGNRPRMVSKLSPDGKTVEFEFLDIAGSTQYGHMHRAAFTIIDANHHIEDWTFIMPGDKPVRAHFDLKRVGAVAAK